MKGDFNLAEEKKLEQTRGRFKLRGKIVGLSSPSAYRSGVIGEGKVNAGNSYHSIRFGVKTSELNTPYVELFGSEDSKVIVYHRDKNNSSSLELGWDERHNIPKDYQLPFFKTTGVGFEFDEKGNVKRKSILTYDAVQEIIDNLEDGDSVYVGGTIQYSEYNGEEQKRFVVDSISKQKDEVDFKDEKFKEMSFFEQELVYVDSRLEREEKKVYLTGRTIDYRENYEDSTFVIDANKNSKFAANVHKMLNFGDLVKVIGYLHNRAIVEEVEEVKDDFDFGGSDELDELDSANRSNVTGYITDLEVINLGKDKDTKKTIWIKGKYKEEDFASGDDPFSADGSEENPFESDLNDEDPFS